jgi:hypothetical protein
MGDRRWQLERMDFVASLANKPQMPQRGDGQGNERRHAPSTAAAFSELLANTP